ncbi:hypothetical protein FIBSPDRAFT_954384 [Athelia psychrophila]|uniref:Uncharacterized protein n=1 Tax=Athelia psychrophila TaxID=1759441 RepID=A0A166JBG3_9AGAM|nr:hypothetical protein FIBSPDRAFT_954384 [Fibularhizoctonia sp. CBS 109695]
MGLLGGFRSAAHLARGVRIALQHFLDLPVCMACRTFQVPGDQQGEAEEVFAEGEGGRVLGGIRAHLSPDGGVRVLPVVAPPAVLRERGVAVRGRAVAAAAGAAVAPVRLGLAAAGLGPRRPALVVPVLALLPVPPVLPVPRSTADEHKRPSMITQIQKDRASTPTASPWVPELRRLLPVASPSFPAGYSHLDPAKVKT